MFPSMIEHRCSEEKRGGFFERIDRGTWMGHVIEHIALETHRSPEWKPVLEERVKPKLPEFIMWFQLRGRKSRIVRGGIRSKNCTSPGGWC